MTLPALATPADVAAALLVDEATLPPGVPRLLEMASAAVRSACGGWTITEETVTDLVVDGTGTNTLLLKTMRLTAVPAVALFDRHANDWAEPLVERRDYDWSRVGTLTLRRGGSWPHRHTDHHPRRPHWPAEERSVRLSYTHGWPADEVPVEIVEVTAALVARRVDNPRGIQSETRTIGAYSNARTYAAPTAGQGPSLTLRDADRDRLVDAGHVIPGSS